MTRRALVIGSQIEASRRGVRRHRMRDARPARGFDVDLRFGDAATRDGILDGYDALNRPLGRGRRRVIYYRARPVLDQQRPDDRLRIVQSIAPTDLAPSGDDDFRGITAWELAVKLAQLHRQNPQRHGDPRLLPRPRT